MKSQILEREAILPRLDGIQKNIIKLKELSKLEFEKFSHGDPFDLAQHHLRLALEGMFHLSSHILSRLPGGRPVEYKEVAKKMGELHVVPKKFSDEKMVPMAGLRNMLVHHYSDIDAERFYEIVRNHLGDIGAFLTHIKKFLKKLNQFGLKIQ